MTIIFQTESAGTPIDVNAPVTELDNWPRLTKLAWVVINDDFKLVRGSSFNINPDKWTESEHETLGEGKLNLLGETGHPFDHIIKRFFYDYERCDLMVAHDLNLHYGILGAESLRHGVRTAHRIENKLCTKTQVDEAYKGEQGRKLSDLWFALFGSEIDDGIDLMVDVRILVDIFSELCFRGIRPWQKKVETI